LQAEDFYFLATNDRNRIIAALPAFIKRNEHFGNVLNSLPFYGSIGGIIEHEDNYEAKRLLLNAFNSFALQNNCFSATIISSPFETNVDFYEEEINFSYRDERIGQLTKLPTKTDSVANVLMEKFEGVRRRNIRKALKSGVSVIDKNTPQNIQFLIDTHIENIRSIGSIPKPRNFFEMIPQFFNYGTDYRIFTAFKDEVPIAALLLFYFNKTVEYFTPVVIEEFRSLQPLSLLIFEAMQAAARDEFEWWNWGGTWHSQKSLYDFKKRWGTKDLLYTYYTTIYCDISHIQSLGKSGILEEYPYFYVMPFSKFKITS